MTHEVPSSLPPADAAAPRGGDPARAPGAGPGPAGRPATAPAAPGSGTGPATTGPATTASPAAGSGATGPAATTSPATASATSGPAAAEEADVIVVGAGPAGSATACYLARAGVDVLVLEKACFPREKVCGDGLTPRAVKALVGMGVPVDEQDGWVRNKGLRIIGGGVRLELPWPELSSYPGYGLVRSRLDFDEILARTAQKAGARLLEGVTVTGPVLDANGRIVGVRARSSAGEAGPEGGAPGAGGSRGAAGVAPPGQQSRSAVTAPG